LDYTQRSYAHAAIELLKELGVKEVIVLGWSLGGHVGIEMISLAPAAGLKIMGLMIVGTPPVGYGDLDKGFTFGPKGWKGSWVCLRLLHALIIRNRPDVDADFI
jgi:pimeloyl-ACP methyl ester carboxylesterase